MIFHELQWETEKCPNRAKKGQAQALIQIGVIFDWAFMHFVTVKATNISRASEFLIYNLSNYVVLTFSMEKQRSERNLESNLFTNYNH